MKYVPCRMGESSDQVRFIQQLVTLAGFAVLDDGDYGPVTGAALSHFRMKFGLSMTDAPVQSVDQLLWTYLMRPLFRAQRLEPDGFGVSSDQALLERIRWTAWNFVEEHPVEFVSNRGPWVKLMSPEESTDGFPWCAGFVSRVVRIAAKVEGVPAPVVYTLGCNELAASAKRNGRLVLPGEVARFPARPGDLVLIPHATEVGRYVHVAIVVGYSPQTTAVKTIEGNTNADGSAEGREATVRLRSSSKLSIVRMH